MSFKPKTTLTNKSLKVANLEIDPVSMPTTNLQVGYVFKIQDPLYSQRDSNSNRITGNLSYSLVSYNSVVNTLQLSAGRYMLIASVPCYGDGDTSNYFSWAWFKSSDNSTYTEIGKRGRVNAGVDYNDSGDNAGPQIQSYAIVESSSTIYMQVRVTENQDWNLSFNQTNYRRPTFVQIWKAE